MYKITVFSVGKTKDPLLAEGIKEYEKRLSSQVVFTWILVKQPEQLEGVVGDTPFIALTPEAKQLSSEAFSENLFKLFETFGSQISFLIGGAEGIDPGLLKRADQTISFSKMTFTHLMIRLLLVEQIYRAFEIRKGSRYHK